jgi:hypothetical protein
MRTHVITSLLSICCCLAIVFCVAGVSLGEDTYTNDFTKDLGKWKLMGAEGKVDKDGLKITKTDLFGGIGQTETVPQDLSAFEAITIEIANGGAADINLSFKIGCGADKSGEDFSIPAGKTITYKRDLSAAGVDLKKIDYMKLFATEAMPTVNITIKKITMVKGTATTAPAGTPTTQATTAPAGPYEADFTKDLNKWMINGADGKLTAGEGVVLTNLKETGGMLRESKPTDLSATTKINFEVVNNGAELSMTLKVKSGASDVGSSDVTIPAGKSTVTVNLTDVSNIDAKKITYVKLFGAGDCKLTIKRVWLTK